MKLKLYVLFVLTIYFLTFWSITKAHALTSDDALHPVAHAAGSYALTHVSEVICRKVSGASKLTCSLIGGAIATGAGIAVEATQHENASAHRTSFIENGAGVLLAIGVINFDF